MLHVRVGACLCALTGARACMRARIYACMIYYIIIYAGAVCAYVYVGPTYVHANVCAYVCAGACAYATARAVIVRMCAYVCG